MAEKVQYVVEYDGELLPYISDSEVDLMSNIEDYKSDRDIYDSEDDEFTVYKLSGKFKFKRTVTLSEIKPPKKKKKAKAKAKLRKVTVKDRDTDDPPNW